MTITNLMAAGELVRGDRAAARDSLVPARVRAAAIVVGDTLLQQTPHMLRIQWNNEIQTVTADRANQAFAERVRLPRPHSRTVSPLAHFQDHEDVERGTSPSP
jgi:hypothetical protein